MVSEQFLVAEALGALHVFHKDTRHVATLQHAPRSKDLFHPQKYPLPSSHDKYQ